MPAAVTLSRLVGICILLTFAGVVHADNWERFRGPNGTGISNDKNIPIKFSKTENVRWKVKIDGAGHSSPIVWGNRVFLQTASLDASTRSLICLDAKTGKEIWTRSIPGTKPKQSLRSDTSLASATPTTDGEAVFVPFWNGKDIIMTAYSFKDGEKLWERNLGEFVSQHGAGASPILYKNVLIFSIDKDAYREVPDLAKKASGSKKVPMKKIPVANPSTLYGLDKKTGKTIWEDPREAIRACYSPPFLIEKPGAAPELIVTSTTAITNYNPATGKANWYWTWTFKKDPLRTIGATTYADGMLLALSGDGSGERMSVGVALKGKGKDEHPELRWSNTKEFPYMTCPLVKGEYIYFANDLGRAGCFVAKTGKRMWFETLPDAAFYASPILIDGNIYAASAQGDVFVFPADPKEYTELARNSLGEIIRATPAVANGALYIRTEKHLYCIGR